MIEPIVVTVKSIMLYDAEGKVANVELRLDKPIKGFSVDKTGVSTEGDVDTVSISRSQFTKDVCELDDLVAEYRGTQQHAFNQKQLGLIFRDAVIKLGRERKEAGEEVLDDDGNIVKGKDGSAKVYARDCYITKILGVTLTPRAIAKLDAACAL